MIGVLQGIAEMFSSLFSLLRNIVDFVIKLFADLVSVVRLLADTVAQLPNMLGFLPSTVLAVILAAFTVVVIYKVLGREG